MIKRLESAETAAEFLHDLHTFYRASRDRIQFVIDHGEDPNPELLADVMAVNERKMDEAAQLRNILIILLEDEEGVPDEIMTEIQERSMALIRDEIHPKSAHARLFPESITSQNE